MLAAAGLRLAVEKRPLGLRFPEERRREADTIEAGGRGVLGTGELEQRGQPVLETRHTFARGPGGDFSRPTHEAGHPEARLVVATFLAAQAAGAVEKSRVGPAETLPERAVVAAEDDDRVFAQAQLVHEREESADVAIEARDHRGVGGARGAMRQVTVATGVRLLGKRVLIFRQRIFGHLQREVRDGGRVIEEEGAVLVVAQKFPRRLVDEVGRVVGAGERRVARGIFRIGAVGEFLIRGKGGVAQRHAFAVIPEARRIEIVRDGLIVVTEEAVHALVVGIAGGADAAEAPLAETTGGVTEFFQRERELKLARWHGLLTLWTRGTAEALAAPIVTDVGVAGVFSRHEHATRRRADVVTGIVVRELHAIARELVEVGRADFFLPEGPDVAVAKIVSEEENNIRLRQAHCRWARWDRRRGGGGASYRRDCDEAAKQQNANEGHTHEGENGTVREMAPRCDKKFGARRLRTMSWRRAPVTASVLAGTAHTIFRRASRDACKQSWNRSSLPARPIVAAPAPPVLPPLSHRCFRRWHPFVSRLVAQPWSNS